MITYFSQLSARLSGFILLLLIVLSCTKNDNRVAAPRTIPDLILEDSQFSLLRTAIAYAGVGDALKDGNLTLFAPTDSAFQASGFTSAASLVSMPREQVRGMVLYHTLYGSVASTRIPLGLNAVETANQRIAFFNKASDGTVYFNNAKLLQVDLPVANGYVHKIDRVLTPSMGNLLTTIQANSNLTFLAAAIKRIGTSNSTLASAINNAASTNLVTMFAPNDEAFRASTQYNTIAVIESADPQNLANMLLYHVTSGVLFSNQLTTGTVKSMFGGNTFNITVNPAQTTIKGNNNQTAATVKQSDIPATNGVIHIIDQVLQP